jgi:hypothetical protein
LHEKLVYLLWRRKKGKPGKAEEKRKSIKMWIENRKCGVGEWLVLAMVLFSLLCLSANQSENILTDKRKRFAKLRDCGLDLFTDMRYASIHDSLNELDLYFMCKHQHIIIQKIKIE